MTKKGRGRKPPTLANLLGCLRGQSWRLRDARKTIQEILGSLNGNADSNEEIRQKLQKVDTLLTKVEDLRDAAIEILAEILVSVNQ